MSELRINTDDVRTTAEQLSSINNLLKGRMGPLATKVRGLGSSWEGSAANATISRFSQISGELENARYSVLKNYVLFLREQIGEGYDVTEEANISLADRFK